MGYLPTNFFDSLPINTTFGGAYRTFMITKCSNVNYLFYELELPTAAETAALNNVASGCANAAQYRDTYGMRAIEDLTVQ